jgi:hypothetical protein
MLLWLADLWMSWLPFGTQDVTKMLPGFLNKEYKDDGSCVGVNFCDVTNWVTAWLSIWSPVLNCKRALAVCLITFPFFKNKWSVPRKTSDYHFSFRFTFVEKIQVKLLKSNSNLFQFSIDDDENSWLPFLQMCKLETLQMCKLETLKSTTRIQITNKANRWHKRLIFHFFVANGS